MITRAIVPALALAAVIAPAAALADEILALTPSGTAEALFDKSLPDTIATLGSFCMTRGWSVTGTTSNQVTCELPMSVGQSIMGTLLIGNSYSTPPRQFVQFNAAQLGAASRVQVQNWMELQMAFGQMRRTDFSGPTFVNNAIGMLVQAGGRLPPGTTFPNHAMMGFEGETIQSAGKQALRVKAVQAGSAAEQAGIQTGDVVFQIAGKRWKDDKGYWDATAKAADTATYEVQATRDGKPIKFVVARAFRPAVVAPEPAPSPPAVVQASTSVAPTSLADELGKLAGLREKGILTDAEFQAQKARLLNSQ